MIKKARARYEISLSMLKRKARVHFDDKVIRKGLLTRNIKFRRLRTKPLLTRGDRIGRKDFAKKYRRKSRAWWLSHIHVHIDLKNFPVYTHARARDMAAMRQVRGAYRAPGQGLDEAYVVVPKDMRYNPGARSCRIAAGVGGGKVLVWHEVGKRWSGKVAADLYKGPIQAALERSWPKQKRWMLLEDNDPAGFKSRQGVAAKKAANIKVFDIPKRSPDLNVCDFALWKEVTRRMRLQEKNFARSKRETRSQYISRLKKTATRLPAKFISDSIADMQRRCQRLWDEKGGHFQEDGR